MTTKRKTPNIHTYSIIAIDQETGMMGGAVQSHYFSVGSAVIWPLAGRGVIATQAMANLDFGPEGLELLKTLDAQKTLDQLLEQDKGRENRQAAALDVQGTIAAFTGKAAIREAGHIVGSNYSVQANMMLNSTVPEAMAKAFENTKGSLEIRLLAALQAAEKEGGDIRGMQSAALKVVPIHKKDSVFENQPLDLRVEDHPRPLDELERLIQIKQAYALMEQGEEALQKKDKQKSSEYFHQAVKLYPESLEIQYWYALALADTGSVDEAVQLLKGVYKKDDNWRELTRRLPETGLFNWPKDILKKLTEC